MLVDPIAELWERVVEVPSVFGRLLYVADLWNVQTGRYDRGLPDRFRTTEIDKAVANWHRVLFRQWLALTLDQKQDDISLYSTTGNQERIRAIRQDSETAIPPLVGYEERRLFIQDLTVVLPLL